jgi:hypothetical protein
LASIVVRFPTSKSKVNIKGEVAFHGFRTVLPGFKHVVHDLHATFERFYLATAGRPVFVEAASAVNLKVFAPGGPIFGSFESSKLVELVSLHKPIRATVALFSGSHDQPFNATRFKAVTGNSWVAANVSLHETSGEKLRFPPSYWVETVSSGSSTWRGHTHSGTNLTFISQPANSSLSVNAFTRDAPAFVSVQPAFQGWFDLVAAFSRPLLSRESDEDKDPSGEGRERVVEFRKSWIRWQLKGIIKWVKKESATEGEGKEGFGKVKIVTTRHPAQLNLAA